MKLLTETTKSFAEHLEIAFESQDHLQDELYNGAIRQGTLFAALSVLKETDRINGMKVVADYTIGKVKQHFKNQENKTNIGRESTRSSKNGISKNKENNRIEFLKNNFINHKEKTKKQNFTFPKTDFKTNKEKSHFTKASFNINKENRENKFKELQRDKKESSLEREMKKQYMKLLSSKVN